MKRNWSVIMEKHYPDMPEYRRRDIAKCCQRQHMQYIEKLLYFREWALLLHKRTRNAIYYQMNLNIYHKLRNAGVICSDVGVEK